MSEYRRLTRSTTDRRIAGVCGGLANYLNIDPTVVRIIFLLALICGTFGFWAYLIVWIAAPEDDVRNKDLER
ncbi:MAG: PspC domain-containing protein [Bacteroidales bacterium]|nr:PspC domain-containing protein [Bacteroidales bacterium]